MTFEELEQRYYELRGRHACGQLSNAEFQAEVDKLTLEDAQGRLWTIGAESGQWYVSQAGEWVQAEPTRAAPSTGEVCPKCGAPTKPGTSFCGQCGHPLTAAARGGPKQKDGGRTSCLLTLAIILEVRSISF